MIQGNFLEALYQLLQNADNCARVDTSGRGASNTAGEYDGNSTARGGATTGGYDDNLSKSTSNFSGTTLGESGATHGSNTTGGYGTTGNNSGNNQDL